MTAVFLYIRIFAEPILKEKQYHKYPFFAVKEPELIIYSADPSTVLELPVSSSSVVGGFPSPAEGYIEGSIDLNKTLVKSPATTFIARAKGLSMEGRGIATGDLVVIDRSIEPYDGCIVVAWVDDGFTMKTFRIKGSGKNRRIWLEPANPEFPVIEITEDNQFIIWGVVTYTIQKHLK